MDKYLDLRKNIQYKSLKEPAQIIQNGGIVVFPTETVYGIGTNGLDEKAIEKLYNIKQRPFTKPISLLVSNIEMINKLAKDITELEYKLMEKFFPGPLTIILNKNEKVPNIITAGSDKVGVRIPNNKIAQDIINSAKVPIAAPSANISGRPSITNIDDDIEKEFKDIEYIIDGGNSKIGLESTIVEVIEDEVHILRPGIITYEEIKKVCSKVKKDYENIKDEFNHYIPNYECRLVYSKENKKMIEKIKQIAKLYPNPIILSTAENINEYCKMNIINIGSKFNLEEISKNIFKILRQIEKLNPDIVIIEGVEKDKLGIAIMDRLEKACKGNYIEIK